MRSISKGICGATLALVASAASAQSSVTLYGVVDVWMQYLNNGGQSSVSERSGGNTGSMIGFKGKEDLGGGLSAIFTLEGGFNTNNGAFFADSSTMFYRQAWVGLSHEKYGTLTFGRQYQPTFWAIYPSEPFRADEVLSPLAALSVSTGTDRNTLATQRQPGRLSNTVVYVSPNMAGLTLRGLYAFSDSTTQPYPTKTGNYLDVAATYSGYGFYGGLAYSNQHGGTANIPGLPGTLNMLSTEHFTAAIAYRIGIVNLQANYSYNRPDDAPVGSLAARLNAVHSFSIMEVGATIQATPFDTIEIAGLQRAVRGVHDNNVAFELGYDHALSKRTTLYARAGYIKNNGSGNASWPGITPVAPGSKQVIGALGMTHRF
ncbi:porin [Caballeronia cordobensis]|uniref:porin n=1 Tax=Caballeronia cordobensis TaxID=1353886 RepID=UPI0002388477|nr:porin Gram-negative type [Burkholderia sp. YI23]BAO92202.1 porin Gram-negative type [Burkholderia sp. RPE67]